MNNTAVKKIAIIALVLALLAFTYSIDAVNNATNITTVNNTTINWNNSTFQNVECIEVVSSNGTYWNMRAEDTGINFTLGRC